jgi:hypothetical protein
LKGKKNAITLVSYRIFSLSFSSPEDNECWGIGAKS